MTIAGIAARLALISHPPLAFFNDEAGCLFLGRASFSFLFPLNSEADCKPLARAMEFEGSLVQVQQGFLASETFLESCRVISKFSVI